MTLHRISICIDFNFLANYDHTKAAIQEIVDMPDRQIDLFVRFCLQNHGLLSAAGKKRQIVHLPIELQKRGNVLSHDAIRYTPRAAATLPDHNATARAPSTESPLYGKAITRCK